MKNVIFDDKRRGGGLDGFDVAFYSDIGRRSSQQDSAYLMAGEQAAFAVLCDGMGGARGGQLASASAVDILRAYYAHYLVHGREMQDSAWMREAAEAADNMVHGLRDAGGNPLGAGTTLVAVSAVRDYFSWISVGDSRLYILRQETLVRATTDHNYMMHLDLQRSAGKISEDTYARESKSGDALISFIGMGGLLMEDISDKPFRLLPGDVLLLCSDGLYRTVTDQELQILLFHSQNIQDAAEQICTLIQQRMDPEQDNVTFILIEKK